MRDTSRLDATAIAIGVAVALVIMVVSGLWVVGVVVGFAAGAIYSDKARRRAGLPERGFTQVNSRKRNRRR
jgi:hypothetical protein